MRTVGSLCTGYGGLDMAVAAWFNAEMVWYSEVEKHSSTLLSRRFPGIPNLGDLTIADWASVPPVDILTGGYPCQPFSNAGLQQGENDERHLWPYIRSAIRVLRPKVAILENVAGHRANGFATVLRDCAEDGLDVRWTSVRASDAGAPHGRERLFFVVTDADGARCEGDQFRFERHEPTDKRRGEAAVTVLGRNDAIPWGKYERAIRQWENILGRPAPDPTEPNRLGRPRLSAVFHEWMMGLPQGWVTDMDIPYTAKLRLTGNGVVPQQAELALDQLAIGVDITSLSLYRQYQERARTAKPDESPKSNREVGEI